ncbi:MAG: hypothetical protein ABIH48_03180 [Candidatus Falkowbacteria bacterium]
MKEKITKIKSTKEEKTENKEYSERVQSLWSGYFQGKPPRPNSGAEERLIKNCKEYIGIILKSYQGKIAPDKVEAMRAKAHNDIITMVIPPGVNRLEIGEDVTEFASRIVYGVPLRDIINDIRKAG